MHVNDRWMFWGLYPLLAVLIVHIGNDNPLPKLVQQPSYYSDLVLALACAYIIGIYFRQFFRKLDLIYGWKEALHFRWLHQLLLGVIWPVVVIIGIELVYLRLIGIPLRESPVFYLELPLVTLFCLLINLIYYLLYSRRNDRLTMARIPSSESVLAKPNYRAEFLVHGAVESKVVEIEQVAYFIILEKSTFLVTTAGRQFPYDYSLEQVSELIDPGLFFQANRQLVVRRSSISGYRRTETRRLELTLDPPAGHAQFVPKTKAAEFIKWLEE